MPSTATTWAAICAGCSGVGPITLFDATDYETRIAAEVAQSKIANLKQRETELMRMREMVEEAVQILHSCNRPIEEFGDLLHEAWQTKKQLSDKVSTGEIDQIYQTARDAGAIGGKILGAGGGGFLLLFQGSLLRVQLLQRCGGSITTKALGQLQHLGIVHLIALAAGIEFAADFQELLGVLGEALQVAGAGRALHQIRCRGALLRVGVR